MRKCEECGRKLPTYRFKNWNYPDICDKCDYEMNMEKQYLDQLADRED